MKNPKVDKDNLISALKDNVEANQKEFNKVCQENDKLRNLLTELVLENYHYRGFSAEENMVKTMIKIYLEEK